MLALGLGSTLLTSNPRLNWASHKETVTIRVYAEAPDGYREGIRTLQRKKKI
jgi:hypothetical protein